MNIEERVLGISNESNIWHGILEGCKYTGYMCTHLAAMSDFMPTMPPPTCRSGKIKTEDETEKCSIFWSFRFLFFLNEGKAI